MTPETHDPPDRTQWADLVPCATFRPHSATPDNDRYARFCVYCGWAHGSDVQPPAPQFGVQGAVYTPPLPPWQPIETHDRSRRPILVGLIHNGQLCRVELAVFSSIGYYTRFGGVACHWRTHWMPAPLPETDIHNS